MKKTLKKLVAVTAAVATLGGLATSLAACGPKPAPDTSVTYNTFTDIMPSCWSELNWQTNNDSAIYSYIVSSFATYDYAFDTAKGGKFTADGKVNKDAIKTDGSYVTQYSAATAYRDVTSEVDAKWGYTAEEKAMGGYAWEITLRNDLKWDDGTVINADDFVYSMKEMLNPLFLNYRANMYYERLELVGARNYFKSFGAVTVTNAGFSSNQEAIDEGYDLYIDAWGAASLFGMSMQGGAKVLDINEEAETFSSFFTLDATETMPQMPKVDDETMYLDTSVYQYVNEDGTFDTEAMEEDGISSPAEFIASAADFAFYLDHYGGIDVGDRFASYIYIVLPDDEALSFDTVGIFASADKTKVTVCMEKPISCLNSDNSLSWRAAYEMSSLPLVKQSLYESCKQAPVPGSALWTSTYCTSAATTASWGAYRLADFQNDKSYTLEKNPYWYGYNMDDNKDQYKIDKIYTQLIPTINAQWMAFNKGEIDDIGLDVPHYDDYKDSAYCMYTASPGAYGLVIASDINTLKNNNRNTGVLAITDFRKALALSLNRSTVVEQIWSGIMETCLGALNGEYLYDVDSGLSYRGSEQGKKALLRAYGFTENVDHTWNGAGQTNLSLDAAYARMTGYNPTEAKAAVERAWTELTTNPEKYGYTAGQKIKFKWGGTPNDDPSRERRLNLMKEVVEDLIEGTGFEGQIEWDYDKSFTDWSGAIKSCACDFWFGAGVGNNPFDPFDFVGAYVDPTENINYHQYWDTNSVMRTITLPEGDYDGAGTTVEASILNWFHMVNGTAAANGDTVQLNLGNGFAPAETRLEVLAVIEEAVLTDYSTIFIASEFSGALLGAKFSYICYEYNTMVGYGGIRYMQVNYNNSEWSSYVSGKGGNLETEYKKTEL